MQQYYKLGHLYLLHHRYLGYTWRLIIGIKPTTNTITCIRWRFTPKFYLNQLTYNLDLETSELIRGYIKLVSPIPFKLWQI